MNPLPTYTELDGYDPDEATRQEHIATFTVELLRATGKYVPRDNELDAVVSTWDSVLSTVPAEHFLARGSGSLFMECCQRNCYAPAQVLSIWDVTHGHAGRIASTIEYETVRASQEVRQAATTGPGHAGLMAYLTERGYTDEMIEAIGKR